MDNEAYMLAQEAQSLMSKMDPHKPTPGLNKEIQIAMNEFLKHKGQKPIKVDGYWGPKTNSVHGKIGDYIREYDRFDKVFGDQEKSKPKKNPDYIHENAQARYDYYKKIGRLDLINSYKRYPVQNTRDE